MKQIVAIGASLSVLALAGCGNATNPLTNPNPATDLELPPGTENPTSGSSVERYEEEDGSGNGYAQSITYNAANNTFSVDNLAFDANNVYAQDDVVATLGPYRVYENTAIYHDDVTGAPINQYPHKAIYGVSTNTNTDGDPITQFAIVRTGAYIPYGFGGFVYQRDGGVTIPTQGQAHFSGAYAGLRDFNGVGGLEYATGDMEINIDFRDFNEGNGVDGHVMNRRIYDLDGNDITGAYTAALGVSVLPWINFTVGPGVMNDAGEISGEVTSYVLTELYEQGQYFAVLAGAGANMEVVGVIVVESDHPYLDNVQARETGGFILYR